MPRAIRHRDLHGPDGLAMLARTRDATWFKTKGCAKCSTTGYRGRIAIHEILVVDESVRRLVDRDLDLDAVQAAARKAGMKTLVENGMEKAARGLTSIEEVLRVCSTMLSA